jgi:hypothetical protein
MISTFRSPTAREVVLTSYFTSSPDPQRTDQSGRQLHTVTDSFDYIYPWYVSMCHANLVGIIFHDSLSESFVNKFSTPNICFCKVKLGNYSVNDERFLVYNSFLEKNEFSKVLMTDVSDVFIKRDPFPLFAEANTLYIGSDDPTSSTIQSNSWALTKSAIMAKEGKGKIDLNHDFLKMKLMNAGVIGGQYGLVRIFLNVLSSVIKTLDSQANNNMMAVHYVAYKLGLRTSIGYPLTSTFKRFEINSDAYIVHK